MTWWDKLIKKIQRTNLYRSIWRQGLPETEKQRAQVIMGSLILHMHPVKAKKHSLKVSYTWCMGGISFFLFLVLAITGVLLMFYYRPSTTYAYQDVKDLEFAVSLGMLLRNLHRWSAHGMVISVIAHMARVFYTGSYKPPREFNWVVGVALLVLTLLLSFTGYLLPWDQLAFWAITVGTNMAGATPFLGANGPFPQLLGMQINNDARFMLLGGTIVGQNALLRFYVLHCIALPMITALLMAFHFYRIRKDGGLSGPL